MTIEGFFFCGVWIPIGGMAVVREDQNMSNTFAILMPSSYVGLLVNEVIASPPSPGFIKIITIIPFTPHHVQYRCFFGIYVPTI